MDFQSAFVIASEQHMLMVLQNGGKEIIINPNKEEISDELRRKTGWAVRYNGAELYSNKKATERGA